MLGCSLIEGLRRMCAAHRFDPDNPESVYPIVSDTASATAGACANVPRGSRLGCISVDPCGVGNTISIVDTARPMTIMFFVPDTSAFLNIAWPLKFVGTAVVSMLGSH